MRGLTGLNFQVMTLTLEVVRELLHTQSSAYTNAFKLMFDEMKQEMRLIQKAVAEVKASLEFSQAKCEEKQSQLQSIEIRLSMTEGRLNDAEKQIEGLEGKQEYAENQSRRNNLKLIGVPESSEEKTWDDTEGIVKDLVKEKLGIQEELQIERCHRVNHKPGSKGHDQNKPRHIVAKFVHWKQKVMIVKKAREKKPDGILFFNDYSANTLARRQAQIPLLDKMRKQGKIAYFIKDRLIVKDKPPDRKFTANNVKSDEEEDDEITVNFS